MYGALSVSCLYVAPHLIKLKITVTFLCCLTWWFKGFILNCMPQLGSVSCCPRVDFLCLFSPMFCLCSSVRESSLQHDHLIRLAEIVSICPSLIKLE